MRHAPFRPLPLASACALALCAATAMLAPGHAQAQARQQQQLYTFDIPAGPLATALNELATAAGQSLAFDPELVKGRHSNRLAGVHGVEEALERLLAGSGLTWLRTSDGAYRIEAASQEDGVITTAALSVEGSQSAGTLARDGISDSTAYTSRGIEVAGKLPRSLREIPQSVTVLTEQRLRDQAVVDAAQALNWVPGVVDWQTDQSGTQQFYSRGFLLNNFSIDGNLAGTTFWQLPADLSAYDQMEVLRGPNGLFAGGGNTGLPGGQVNLTRKRPLPFARTELELAAGSWHQYRGTLDINRPLTADGRLRGRAVISYQDREFHYDHGRLENWMLYGVLEYQPIDQLTFTAGIESERRDASYMVFGLPMRGDGTFPGWSRSTSNVIPWSGWDGDTLGQFAEAAYAFNDRWKAKLIYTQRREDTQWDFGSVSGVVDPMPGSSQRPLYAWVNWRSSAARTRAAEFNVTGQFDLFGRSHDVVFGLEASKRKSRSRFASQYAYDWNGSVGGRYLIDQDTLDLTQIPWVETPYDPANWTTTPYINRAAYVNLRMRLLEPLTLTAGSRISSYEYQGSFNPVTGSNGVGGYRKSGIHTPFAALTYDFSTSTSAYVSYTDIFRVTNAYTWPAGEMVDPVTGTNLEAGLKSEFMGGRLVGSLAVYRTQLENQTRINPNAPVPCPTAPTITYCYIADNEQRVQGVDFEFNGNITDDWKVSLGATWLQKEYTQWLDRRGDVSATQGTSWRLDTPSRMLKVWTDYRLPGAAANWRIGGGFRAQSEIYSERAATSTIPAIRVTQGGYAVWDAMVAWDIKPDLALQLNAYNILDKRYFSRIGTTYVTWGEPASVMLTLRSRF